MADEEDFYYTFEEPPDEFEEPNDDDLAMEAAMLDDMDADGAPAQAEAAVLADHQDVEVEDAPAREEEPVAAQPEEYEAPPIDPAD
eukprot:6517793-Prymnesium_polylepis.1